MGLAATIVPLHSVDTVVASRRRSWHAAEFRGMPWALLRHVTAVSAECHEKVKKKKKHPWVYLF